MRALITGAVVALTMGSIVAISAGSGPAEAASDKAVIEKRVKFMKTEILTPFLAIKKYVTEGVGSPADVAKNASMLSAASEKIPALFPAGTARGDFDAKVTRALPAIWTDWKGFEAAAARLGTESAKLATVAAGGDKGAIGAQFGATGKNGCGGCHKPFRGEAVK